MFDIKKEDLKLVKSILKRFVPDVEVRAFGSRVLGKAKKYSDLDLALISKKRISLNNISHVKEAFQESDLPFRVDVVLWKDLSAKFRKMIENKYVVLQLN